MSELLEPFDRLLADIATPEAIAEVERGGSGAAMWAPVAQSGFLDALVPEGKGGAGLSLAEALPLVQAVGHHAVPLPVAETMLARRLLADSGADWPEGPIAIGCAPLVPNALAAEHVFVHQDGALRLVDRDTLVPDGVYRSLDMRLADASASEPLRTVCAWSAAAQIAGAADRLLATSVAHANEREQFGKPVGRQQAVQQQLAVMAETVVAIRLASQLASGETFPPNPLGVASAKSVASAGAANGAAIAHAVHGAIGISDEHALSILTRRLHGWRLAHGSEGYWNRLLGEARLSNGALSVDWVRETLFAS